MKPSFFAPLALTISVASLGCAGAQDAEQKQITEMEGQIAKLTDERDRYEKRVDELEIEGAARKPVGEPKAPDAMSTPKLRVVELSPDEELADSPHGGAETVDDPGDGTPPAVIRLTGDGSSSRRRGARDDDQIRYADNGAPAGSDRPSALDPEAKHTYDSALAMVSAKKYNQALDAFASFLVKWPDHPLAENALYWRGESYYALGDFARAEEQFEGVVSRFPTGNKSPDALLKAGLSAQQLGKTEIAKSWFSKLQREYPQSDAARKVPRTPDVTEKRGEGQ
jgi:tol-pal system protein YbgF